MRNILVPQATNLSKGILKSSHAIEQLQYHELYEKTGQLFKSVQRLD